MPDVSIRSEFETLKAIVDGIDDVIYIADPDTYELLHANEALRGTWGSDIIGKKCHKVLQDRNQPCPFCTNNKIFGKYLGRSYVWEFQNKVNGNWYRCSDKAIRWVDGRMVRFELAADITEAKMAEQALKDSREELESTLKRLRQSNEDLQQFAYVASHDLQEPLRMVSSFTQLIAERYQGKLDEKADRWIHFAVDGANRMQALIQDLLSFSRVNTHGAGFGPVELAQAASGAMANLTMAVEEAGAKISVEDLPVVHGDAGQLTLVFQNLIGNAVKFCRDEPPRIRISAEQKAGEWVVCVRDNGIGIDAAYMKKIFIIFQRLHTREEYPGTGLGLAVCKRILQRHKGRIWVESEMGRGSGFYFSLPDAPGGEP
ncbi:MAG: ATP-binding protein [Desulfobacter sp.]